MTIDAAVLIGEGPDSLEGTKVTTPAGTDLFREGVVISDPEIPGARAEVRQMGAELTTADWGLVTHSVIQGFSTGQGGGYHDVKVTPSGALTVEATVTGVVSIEGTVNIAEPVTVDGSVSVNNFPATQAVTGTVAVSSVPTSQADINVTGTWAYAAGTSGTVTLPAGSKVLQISATSLLGGSFTVNGGAAITIPANQQFTLEPRGNLVAPTLVFTSTTAFVVEYVS